VGIVDDLKKLGVLNGEPERARRGQRDPSEMAAAEINRELDRLDRVSRKLNQKFIDAGRGFERPSETWEKSDPLAEEFKRLSDRRDSLRREVTRRAGPGMDRLPRGFGPLRGR
jgi:hypothetical protein